MSDVAKWTKVDVPKDASEFTSKTSASNEHVYPFDDGRDENAPNGLFFLIDIIIGVGILVALRSIMKAIWKRFLCENR